MLAITVFGTPVALQVDVPTYVDRQSAVLWASGLKTSIRKTAKAAAVFGRGSGGRCWRLRSPSFGEQRTLAARPEALPGIGPVDVTQAPW